jgi:hypothetical protein
LGTNQNGGKEVRSQIENEPQSRRGNGKEVRSQFATKPQSRVRRRKEVSNQFDTYQSYTAGGAEEKRLVRNLRTDHKEDLSQFAT